jgi:hypothetical protein
MLWIKFSNPTVVRRRKDAISGCYAPMASELRVMTADLSLEKVDHSSVKLILLFMSLS